MKQKLTLLILSVLMTVSYGFSQGGLGTIRGTVTDAETNEPIAFALVLVKKEGSNKGKANTDFDGKFQVSSLEPGSYTVEVSNSVEQYQPITMEGVIVSANQITFLDDLTLSKKTSEIEVVKIIAYRVPLINRDGGASGATITKEDIARMPARSASGVASTVGGVNVDEGSGDVSVRGSRSDGTYFYIDGIKVRGSSNLPKSAIEEVSVITGGVPANYGDITGGIISVTTRGPSSQFFGSAELVTSGFYFKGADPDGYDGKVIGLDKYGYNLFEGMISGPLLMQRDSTGAKTKPLLGFMLSANLTDELDNRPLFGGTYRVKKEVRDELLANPLRPNATGDGTYNSANFLRKDDFENVAWRMNARNTVATGNVKIDVKTGPSMNLTFGGSMNYEHGNSYSRNNSLLNFANFGMRNSLDYRMFGRLTQRFSNDSEGSSSKIKSAYYTLMVDYSKSQTNYFDPKHKYNIFNYGHVGTYTTTRRPSYTFDSQNQVYVHDGFKDVRVDFDPSETNAALAAITTQYYEIFKDNPIGQYENLTQITQGNALRNGDSPQSVYDIWSNLGAPYNYFEVSENQQFRFTGSGSVVYGDHSLTLGFEFEQRVDRSWRSGTTVTGGGNGPISIWTMTRGLTNSHIRELDVNQATISDSGSFKSITFERLNTGYAYTSGTGIYGGQENEDQQSFFDYNLRKKLGLHGGGTEFIDIDMYDPSTFTLDMFSADELLNSGNSYVSYWGYDHAGNKVRGNTDINKYFTEYDENGNYKRFVGAFQPTYMSGYLMDKFAFRDLIFNVGVRVDVFDANQPTLKDPYLLYTAKSVSEAKAILANDPSMNWINIPESMGDDYVVYVNDVASPSAINGFRNGNVWYDANGIEVSDAKAITGAGGIAPWINSENLDGTVLKSPTSEAFKDYKASVNVMPRIAFSFPISDEASFFAHYDILTKRPTSGYRFDPFDYQFMRTRSATIDNANLKPETTIDYEIGFQQVLSKTSSIKISAFYREQRNNVQLMNVFEAYPATYKTYGNRDFGTVKGTTIAYDLRRTGNVRMTANYTLQFADGTGSDATSANGLINAGLPNLRAVFPYSFDTRHAFAFSFDYRYGEGKDYNGPVIGKANVLENTGLNLISNVYSGSPYSSQNQISNEGVFNPSASGLNGTTNGSRLPWSYRLDLQLDKTFNLEFGKGDDKKKTSYLNVYVRVTNLLNQQNRLSVYRATGNWNDDGFLAAAASQNAIQNQLDEQSFRDYYLMKIQNAYNISAPRTIRLGVKFDF
jgi:hypothetical protein